MRFALRGAVGLLFITFGQMKFFDSILLGNHAVSLPAGPEGFAQYLDAVGIPYPLLNAYMVCLVEMLCGLGLLLSPFLPYAAILTRLCALPLMMDMVVATITVGLRNALGIPVQIHGVAVTAQPWRLPLEFSLMVLALFFLWRPVPRRAPAVAVAPEGSSSG
ncbi:MAG: DoxX family protein [Hyalangium sp.]|uniref:DoxX family protein n=1 Tax=Hyalangium sp. TaxID=2028555 RepID=UPI003899F934